MIGGLGPTELILIAGVLFLLFGAKKIPEFARSLGTAQTEFQNARHSLDPQTLLSEPAQTTPSKPDTASIVKSKPTEESERARLLAAARQLNIEVEGRSLEQIREAMTRALGG